MWKISAAMNSNQGRRKKPRMWNFSGLSMRTWEPEMPVEMGMQVLSHLLPFLPNVPRRERSSNLLTGGWMGREHCWTPSWLSRAKGKDLGYPTCCRQVYLNLLCKTAGQASLSDTPPDLMVICVELDSIPWALGREELAFSHHYLTFILVYKFQKDCFLD